MYMKIDEIQMGEWLELLKENANIGFVIMNGEGKILSTDPKILSIWGTFLEGMDGETIKGKCIADVINPMNSFSELIMEVRRTGHIQVSEFPFRTQKGFAKWAMLEGWILQETDEDVLIGWSWIDITPVCERTNNEYLEMFKDALNFIFQDIPLLFFFWEITEDSGTKILGVNREGERVLGYTAPEVIGRDFLQFAIPDTWKTAVKKYVEDMRINPKPYLGEHPLSHRNGQEISIRWLDVPVELPMFNRLWVVSIGEDIRERLQIEKELRESEERYRRMVEAITDYFYHVRIVDGKAIETIHSPGCEAVTGYTPEDFYKNPYLWYSMVYDEDKEMVLNFANALTRGENPGPIVHRIIRKDGQVRWIRNTCLLIFDRERNLLGYDSLIRDVTEEIVAQDTLKKSELFYRGIIENLSEGYFEIDLEGNIRFANPSFIKILGKTKLKSLLNRKLIEFIDVEERSQILNLLSDIREKRKNMGFCEWKMKLDSTNEEKIVECSFFPLLSQRGKVKGFSGILRDVTERKKQEEELRQLQKWESLGAIVGGIAHDFNNLLMVIQGHLDLEEEEYGSFLPYEVALHHSEIQGALIKAKELCWQMMIYAGKGFAIHKKVHKINDIIKDMLPVLDTMMKRNITLNINLCDEDTKVLCDEILIRQVILSLITNSIEAIEQKDGTINIFTCVMDYKEEMFSSFVLDGKNLPAGKYVQILIEDTGAGIESKNLDKIFEPFYSSKFLGRGLGLSSVLGIVRSHQGGMKVESKVGVGTKVYVVFPFAISDVSVGTDVREQGCKEKKKVVLIMEQDFMLRELLKRILSIQGFEAVAVSDRNKSMEVIHFSDYDVKLIILDVGFQKKEVKELLSEIRDKGVKLPVILCSSLSIDDIVEEYRDLIVASLRKPYLPIEIIDIVKANWKEDN